MRLKRPIAFILSAALAASALTGCDSFSGHAAAAANSAQVQQLIEFIADLGLERDLRQALQKGGDLRQALLTLLGLENAVNFNVDDLAGARPGQHAVQVWEVTAQSAEDAAALAASQIRAVLEQLKSSGVTEGRIGMVEVDGKYYVVVDVEVTEENTFEPAKPVSDDDDDEDTPSVPTPTATVGDKKIDLSSLTEITAVKILKLAGKEPSELDAITSLDLRGCTSLQSIGGGAFQSCNKLTSIDLSGCTSLKSIGGYAFYNCRSLTKVDLSGCTSLQSIGGNAFQNDFPEPSSPLSVDLSGCTSLTTIGASAFYQSALGSIELPERLTTIDTNAFKDCEQLTSIDLRNTQVNTIDNGAFSECTSLGTVLLPESLEEIGVQIFFNCNSLKNIYFQSVPEQINLNAFSNLNAENITVYYNSSTCNLDDLKDALENKGFSGDFKDFIQGPPPSCLPL